MKEKQENLVQKVAPFADLSTGIHLEALDCFKQLDCFAKYSSRILEQNPAYILSNEFKQAYHSFEATNKKLSTLMAMEDREVEKFLVKYQS